ncbi:MAG: Gfo/Idh/MocA family oxidoreductase [Reichenbachiella sp.]
MKKIKWGIVGPGIIANEFAHDGQFMEHGLIAAVASNSKERGEQFAKKHNIPKVYTSYAALYADPEIDAVYIATPHTFHLQNSKEALQAGKAVLCEKPITVTPDEGKELISVANTTNQYLMEGMWTYFLPAIKKAKQWVDEGRIGKIHHIKSDFGYPVKYDPNSRMFNPELAGGSLLDMGVYNLAMVWHFLEADPDDLQVHMSPAATGVDEEVSITMIFPHTVAQLTTSFRCKLNNCTYIIGDKGYIAIPDFWRAKECDLYELETCVEHFQDDRKGFGFNFEADQVSLDLIARIKESSIVPHHTSMKLQDWMEKIKMKF